MKSKKYQIVLKLVKGTPRNEAKDIAESLMDNNDEFKSARIILIGRKPRTPKIAKVESTPIAGNTKFRNYFEAILNSKIRNAATDEDEFLTINQVMDSFNVISSKLL